MIENSLRWKTFLITNSEISPNLLSLLLPENYSEVRRAMVIVRFRLKIVDTKYIIRGVLYFQRGQKNVRNHTQVKLAATSLECKQARMFQYTSFRVAGRFRLITIIREKN